MTNQAGLRRSPLDDRHRQLGAAMTAFSGWEMPLDYGSVVREHEAVRESGGVFDVSHLGSLLITGRDAGRCLQHALSNDAEALASGRGHYTLCLNDEAGIVDDLLLYRLGWGYLAVPNAANVAKVAALVERSAEALGDCTVTDITSELACLAVQGPRAGDLVAAIGIDVEGLGFLDCRDLQLPTAGASAGGLIQTDRPPHSGVLARSGYTGERGYELFVPAARAGDVWDRLLATGAAPVGLGARDTLRLEMGYALHGNDISPATSPVEARLTWAVAEGTGFRGEDAYRRQKAKGPWRRLWGLRALGRGIPRPHFAVSASGRQVGETTSGTFSPTLKLGIAMAYLDMVVPRDAEVEIDVRGRPLPARVVRPPFVDASPRD